MDYTAAETIAYRLSKRHPWRDDPFTASWPVPEKRCHYCDASRPFNDTGTHDPECLWLNARQYIELREAAVNAPVASQEAQESPIESRVSELLGESEAGDSAPLWKAPFCERRWGDDGHKHCTANMCGCECHA